MQLAVTKIIKPKHNLSRNERKALNELKHHTEINLKKADKGSTTVVMNKNDKIREGQIQIDDQNNYSPLVQPMVKETHNKVSRLISELHHGNHIDDMTKNGCHKHQIRLEYQNSTPLQKFTNQPSQGDQ